MIKKFTPGEWTAHLGIMEPTFVFIGKEDEYVDGETPVICELHHGIKKEYPGNGIMDFDHTEMRANAALIAAAPELFECVCDALSDLQMSEGMRRHFEEVLKKARGDK